MKSESIDDNSPERRHAVAEIPDAEGNYNGRDRGKTHNPGMKLSALELRPGDKIRPVSDASGRAIKGGKVWAFSHIDPIGNYIGKDPDFPREERTMLASSYGWEVLERADQPKAALSDLEYEALGEGTSKPSEETYKGIPDGVTVVRGWPTPSKIETIVAAAIQIEGVTISLPRPARHGTVLAAADWYLKTKPGQEVQGFLTSTGRFVNRIQARHIADIAGQNPGRSGGRDNPELYSEDLW